MTGNPSQWIDLVRHFIVCGSPHLIELACSSCTHPLIRTFLSQPEVTNTSIIPQEMFRPIAQALLAEGKREESTIIELLGCRVLALSAEIVDYDNVVQDTLAVETCERLLTLSQECGFTECQAVFLRILGAREINQQQYSVGISKLRRALEILRPMVRQEPKVFVGIVANILNSIGSTLRSMKEYDEARETVQEVYSLFHEYREMDIVSMSMCLATAHNLLGAINSDERKFHDSYNALHQALEIRRVIAEALNYDPVYLQYITETLHNMGDICLELRQFSQARDMCEEALQIRRSLAQRAPHTHGTLLVNELLNMGNLFQHEHMYGEAEDAYHEGLRVIRPLATESPRLLPYLAKLLCPLANAQVQLGKDKEAAKTYDESINLYRILAQENPDQHEHRFMLAQALTNSAMNVPQNSYKRIIEAIAINMKLANEYPHVHKRNLAWSLTVLASILDEQGKEEEAQEVSLQAIYVAEDFEGDPRERFLIKGTVQTAYNMHLIKQVDSDNSDIVFRTIASLRQGDVMATRTNEEHGLAFAVQELADRGSHIGIPIRVICAQQVNDRLLLSAITPEDSRAFTYEFADDFAPIAAELFTQMMSLFDAFSEQTDQISYFVRNGFRAWKALPSCVRSALAPDVEGTVLIVGDSFWNAFPWEILCCDDKTEAFLGLARPLVRWHSLTAPSFGQLIPVQFGDRNNLASIIAPYDVPGMPVLEGARNEAQAVAESLRGYGFTLIPDEVPMLYREATYEAVAQVFKASPAIIHYTGHGTIIGTEEVLCLYDPTEVTQFSPFGRKEIEDLRVRFRTEDPLLKSGPLVVLNACVTGKTRSFGGQREDLSSVLLAEGANAVIASPFPVSDIGGKLFGCQLYQQTKISSLFASEIFAHTRASIEEQLRAYPKLWPSWAMIHYHGNPFAKFLE